MSSRADSDTAARRVILGGVLAVLAIGAVLLTVLAFVHVNGQPTDEKVAPVPTFTQPSDEPSPTASPTSVPTASHSAYDSAEERFLAVGSEAMWRGVAGRCGSDSVLLERSIDNGETWSDVTPDYLGIGQLQRVSAFAGNQAQIIALMGDACDVQVLRTFTQGRFWEPYDDVLAASQYIDPTRPGTVVRPDGDVDAPCADAHGMQVAGSVVALSCDRTAYVLGADAEWRALPAENVAALTIDDGDVIVAAVAEGCPGLALTRYVDSDSAEDAGCVADAEADAPVAIAPSGEDVLIWSGDLWELIAR